MYNLPLLANGENCQNLYVTSAVSIGCVEIGLNALKKKVISRRNKQLEIYINTFNEIQHA